MRRFQNRSGGLKACRSFISGLTSDSNEFDARLPAFTLQVDLEPECFTEDTCPGPLNCYKSFIGNMDVGMWGWDLVWGDWDL